MAKIAVVANDENQAFFAGQSHALIEHGHIVVRTDNENLEKVIDEINVIVVFGPIDKALHAYLESLDDLPPTLYVYTSIFDLESISRVIYYPAPITPKELLHQIELLLVDGGKGTILFVANQQGQWFNRGYIEELQRVGYTVIVVQDDEELLKTMHRVDMIVLYGIGSRHFRKPLEAAVGKLPPTIYMTSDSPIEIREIEGVEFLVSPVCLRYFMEQVEELLKEE